MFEIYKDFELVMVDALFTNFKWRRRFSRAGDFQLETFFTPEKMEIFAEGNVIYKRDVDEAAFIERRSVIQDINGGLVLVVSGRGIASILDRRVFTLAGSYGLKNFLSTVIGENFLMGASEQRRISNMRMLEHGFEDVMVSADFKRANVYDTLTKILEEHNIGVKLKYNLADETYDLQFYQEAKTDVIFSREFTNIIEQNYTDSTERYKNVVYVDNQYVHNDNLYTGSKRREMVISNSTEGQCVVQNAINALLDNKESKTLSNVVNPYSKQYKYLKDWNIGSVVLAQNMDVNYAESELITEITEFYDGTGLNLEVNLGDYKAR